MDETQCELAHAAGLLHDIGRFALSDRVFERGRTLNDEDWEAIQRHPELGADMLRDLGMYGPVAEIVLCHHERIDGLGYPRRLGAEEIPEIAKIIAVAEVYDTLTASDTYRTRQSSFEALTELRRVSGTQLDGRYIEVLASLLSGEGVEYRHADAVDFDEELGIEEIIRKAGTGRWQRRSGASDGLRPLLDAESTVQLPDGRHARNRRRRACAAGGRRVFVRRVRRCCAAAMGRPRAAQACQGTD